MKLPGNIFEMQFDIKNYKKPFFHTIVGMCALAMFSVMGVYSYLGTYSRYIADDYCEAVLVTRSSPISAVIERYQAGDWRAANRYSNLLFVGFSELIGGKNMQITIASMVIIWAVGLVWSAHELRKFLGINWMNSMDWFLGLTLGMFSFLQAPNLFQTVYWRSSMMTHFAPLVFGTLLFAFWVRQARYSINRQLFWMTYPLIFIATFIIAGFSEPPVTTMVTGLSLTMLAVWIWGAPPVKQRFLALLAWTFAGAFLGLMALVFSPANANMEQGVIPGLLDILRDSFLYSYVFIADSIRVFPIPGAVSFLIPALLVWLFMQTSASEFSPIQKRVLWVIVLFSPVVMWILIAAGFSPSVYGQGYPVERMRFLARTIMTFTIMLEGAAFGCLLRDLKFGFARASVQLIAVAIMILVGFVYPVRAAIAVFGDNHEEYLTRARLWDLREAYIVRHADLGEKDLVIPAFSGVYKIKELDINPNHWTNRCSAQYYGVNTIQAVSVPDDYILEYLSE
jgi:hypothetical protein